MNNKKVVLLWMGVIAALWVIPAIESLSKHARSTQELSAVSQVFLFTGMAVLAFPLLQWGFHNIRKLL